MTGAPTSEALQARVFGPLGMAASGAAADDGALPGPLRGYGWNAASQRLRGQDRARPARWAARGLRSRRWAISRRHRALCTGTLLEPETQAARMETEPFAGGNGVARYGGG